MTNPRGRRHRLRGWHGLLAWLAVACLGSSVVAAAPPAAEVHVADLLVVGGTEAGAAAAVQAARLGVKRIVLVNDIDWLGGQFSAEAVGAIDEWTIYRGKRTNFPRSGMFLEIIQLIRHYNGAKYGVTNPGNAITATETIEPAAAAKIFEEWIAPHTEKGTGQVRLLRNWQPVRVQVEGNRVAAVDFESTGQPPRRMTVRARLTIDASDWGDVIRLSGARYAAGPDSKERFHEPSAPAGQLGDERNEMNPITYCLVLREAGRPSIVPRPVDYDERKYHGTTGVTAREFAAVGWPRGVWHIGAPPFVDTAYPEGIYSENRSVYTQRRLVDRHHFRLPAGTEKVLLNWPIQDYPLYRFPRRVVEALEAAEPGASKKNIVDMTPAQRGIVFEDAKRQSLGMLHHLQTTVHDRVKDYPQSFRTMELTDEFGTPDRLPPKPYVREGLRLEALYMLREQDIRTPSDNPRWARVMVPDGIFGFQFNIDFHPTRRQFLNDDPSGPWGLIHTANRNWSRHTDRALFPLRGLIPVERDGLLGASKNIGVTSITSAAVRLHGQMMLTGQAAGTVASLSLRDQLQPRDLARDWKRIRELQQRLIRSPQGKPGVLLWPYHDLPPDEPHFEAVNHLAIRGIWPGDADSLDFQPWRLVTRREAARVLVRAVRSRAQASAYVPGQQPAFTDLDRKDPDHAFVASLAAWGKLDPNVKVFQPDAVIDGKTLFAWMKALELKPSEGLNLQGAKPVNRAELARHVWAAIEPQPEWLPDPKGYLTPGHDADGDGIPDLDDPLPFDRNNNGLPDRLDPQPPPGAP